MKKHVLMLMAFLSFAEIAMVYGQDSPLPPVTQTFAIKNATIVTEPGKVIEKGTLIVKDGLIQAVGEKVEVPYDAKVIDADSMFVYAGFIDGLSHAGLKKEGSQNGDDQSRRRQRPEGVDPGNPPVELAGIQPQRRVSEMLDPGNRDVDAMRKLGFTAALVAPEDGMLSGYGAVILFAGDTPEEMVLRDRTSLYSQLSGARGVYPATVIGVMSKYRELYMQAEQAMKHETLYSEDPGGMARPVYDKELEALYPVIKGDMPVFFKAADIKSAYRVFTLQEDLGFKVVLAGLKEGWHLTDKIKAEKIPVLLSLDLPEDKSKKEQKGRGEKKEGEQAKAPEKEGQKEMSEEMQKLEARRKEFLQKFVSQPAVFTEKGIPFGFSSLDADAKNIRADLRRMIESGLSEDAALAALTVNPAKILGVEKVMGTVERGKIANLIVTDKPYFDEKSNVRYVMVDGKLFTYEKGDAAKKSSDPEAVAVAAGTWEYKIDVPGQNMGGTMTLVDNSGILEGTVQNPQTRQDDKIENGVVEGNTVSFITRFDGGGQTVTVSWEFRIDGDTFDGKVNAGEFGEFDISGERIGPGGGF